MVRDTWRKSQLSLFSETLQNSQIEQVRFGSRQSVLDSMRSSCLCKEDCRLTLQYICLCACDPLYSRRLTEPTFSSNKDLYYTPLFRILLQSCCTTEVRARPFLDTADVYLSLIPSSSQLQDRVSSFGISSPWRDGFMIRLRLQIYHISEHETHTRCRSQVPFTPTVIINLLKHFRTKSSQALRFSGCPTSSAKPIITQNATSTFSFGAYFSCTRSCGCDDS